MVSRLWLAALALLAVVVTPVFTSAETIRIGAIFSVTGPASFLGEPEKNTALMLAEKINAKGGLHGDKIEVIIYDDESDVNKAVLAADKLIKKDRVIAAIGPSISGNTFAVADKFAKAGIPLVSCAAAEKIVKPVNPFVFKTPQSDRQAVTKILNHAKVQKYKKIAILTVSDGYGQAGREVLKELLPAKGFEMVADEVYGPKDTDMTAQLTKIKGLNPDAIICWGTNPGPAVIARNRVQLGMKTPLYMSHGVASKKFIELAGDAANGLILPAGWLAVAAQMSDKHPQKKLLLEYTKEYQDKYKIPVSTFGGYAYDAMLLVSKAIEDGKSAKPDAIRASLEKVKGLIGITGVFNMTAEDHLGIDDASFCMVEIVKGDWKIIPE